MNRDEAIRVLKLHQEWRMGREPYDKAGCPMPHSPKGLTAALDYAIAYMRGERGAENGGGAHGEPKPTQFDAEWLPIDSLEMEYCHGYAVSKTIMVAIHYPETEQYQIKVSRVWEENGERSLPDIPYGEFNRVTHFRYLPTPPKEQVHIQKLEKEQSDDKS
jgi:hypothetical protein